MRAHVDPPCLNAALDYLARGWAAIPLCPWDHQGCGQPHLTNCHKPGKRPLVKDWQARRLTEPDLRSYWKQHPGANVGVALGPISGLCALDLDGPAGVDLLNRLAREANAVMPETLAFRTGGGGRLLFGLREGEDPPQHVWAIDKGEVLRFQARGGQTVMPPSTHPTGVEYAWSHGGRPDEVELALCPLWLLELVQRLKGQAQPGPSARNGPLPAPVLPDRVRDYLARCGPAVAGQGGHAHTYKVACKVVRGFGLDPESALAALWDWNQTCQPPWSEAELRHKIRDALERGTEPVGSLRETPRRNEAPGSAVPPSPQGPAGPAPPAVPATGRPTPAAVPVATFTAADLLREQLPPLRWVIPGLIPEGGTLLAGRPKGGKSWLALQAALAVAEGGSVWGAVPCEQGEALYLALEDGRRRLQGRLQKLCGMGLCPRGLHLSLKWPTLNQGCIETLDRWLDRHPAVRLVCIDTLTRVRDRQGNHGANSYEIDYDSIAAFSGLGERRHIACVVVHHTRKPKETNEEDPFDTISGTLGLSGAADTMMVLRRPQSSCEGKLYTRGRDCEDQAMRLLWRAEECLWCVQDEDALPPEQRRVLDLLVRAGRPLSPAEVAPTLGKQFEATKKLMARMAQEGRIKGNRGTYEPWPTDVARGPRGVSPMSPAEPKP